MTQEQPGAPTPPSEEPTPRGGGNLIQVNLQALEPYLNAISGLFGRPALMFFWVGLLILVAANATIGTSKGYFTLAAQVSWASTVALTCLAFLLMIAGGLLLSLEAVKDSVPKSVGISVLFCTGAISIAFFPLFDWWTGWEEIKRDRYVWSVPATRYRSGNKVIETQLVPSLLPRRSVDTDIFYGVFDGETGTELLSRRYDWSRSGTKALSSLTLDLSKIPDLRLGTIMDLCIYLIPKSVSDTSTGTVAALESIPGAVYLTQRPFQIDIEEPNARVFADAIFNDLSPEERTKFFSDERITSAARNLLSSR